MCMGRERKGDRVRVSSNCFLSEVRQTTQSKGCQMTRRQAAEPVWNND